MIKFICHPQHETLNRRMTVTGLWDDKDINHPFLIGVALCSNKDSFCRKVGRTISEGRAKKRPFAIHNNVKTFKRAKEMFYKEILPELITSNQLIEDMETNWRLDQDPDDI